MLHQAFFNFKSTEIMKSMVVIDLEKEPWARRKIWGPHPNLSYLKILIFVLLTKLPTYCRTSYPQCRHSNRDYLKCCLNMRLFSLMCYFLLIYESKNSSFDRLHYLISILTPADTVLANCSVQLRFVVYAVQYHDNVTMELSKLNV